MLVLVVAAAVLITPRVIETQWAKERIEKRLEEETGRQVTIGDVDFGWFRGLTVQNVTLFQLPNVPRSAGPLLHIGTMSLDVGVQNLLRRELVADELVVRDAQLTVVRKRDGALNIADLLQRGGHRQHTSAAPVGELPIRVRNATVRYIDQLRGTDLEIAKVRIDAHWQSKSGLRLEGSGRLEGGHLAVRFSTDLSKLPSPFVIDELRIEAVPLGRIAPLLSSILPLLSPSPTAQGRVSLVLEGVHAQGFRMTDLRRSLFGQGKLELDDARFDSEVMGQVQGAVRALPIPEATSFAESLAKAGVKREIALGDLTVRFHIVKGSIAVDPTLIKLGPTRLTLAGSTSLDGDLDYTLRLGGIQATLAGVLPASSPLLSVDELPLTVTGTLAHPKVGIAANEVLKETLPKSVLDLLRGAVRAPGL